MKLKKMHWKKWIASKEAEVGNLSYATQDTDAAERFSRLNDWVGSEYVPGVIPLLPRSMTVFQTWGGKEHPRFEVTLDDDFWTVVQEQAYFGFCSLFSSLNRKIHADASP